MPTSRRYSHDLETSYRKAKQILQTNQSQLVDLKEHLGQLELPIEPMPIASLASVTILVPLQSQLRSPLFEFRGVQTRLASIQQ